MSSTVGSSVASAPATGPLRVSAQNPRYFADSTDKIVYLTGAHTWNSLQDMGETDPPPAFDWDAYLDFLGQHHHNFVRLWRWELTIWDTKANNDGRRHFCAPHPWPRSGPDLALDGKPKFDLSRFDDAYFARLRERVASAGQRGIYVSVMLFEGWELQFVEHGWRAHPFNPGNNINGIGSDIRGEPEGVAVHELGHPGVLALEEAYVRKVVDTVNDLDNVLYEISNENHPASTEWQVHMIRLIHDYERGQGKQHPVGMTFQYRGGSNQTLFGSPADWISPNPDGGYTDAPPAADGAKVIISDTDHLWGIGGNVGWVWKSLCRGMNPIFMDPYDGIILGTDSKWEAVRRALGQARIVADRLPLATMTPHDALSSTGYCLAQPGAQYLIYAPAGGEVTVDLSETNGELAAEWLNPSTGETAPKTSVAGGDKRALTAPFGGDAVLHLYQSAPGGEQ